MKCSICGKSLSVFNKKISNGEICNNCYNSLPSFIQKNIHGMREMQIRDYINYKNSIKFEPTASYGILSVDDMHGCFSINEKGKIYPFYSLDIKNVGLYCTDLKVNSSNKVVCNVEFNCELEHPQISFRIIVKKNVMCFSKKCANNRFEWNEPSDLSMFRNMFNQMIRNENERYTTIYNDKIINKNAIEDFQAKTLFMLGENFTYEDLEKQYKKTISPYKADNPDDSIYIEYINRCYQLLAIKISEEEIKHENN